MKKFIKNFILCLGVSTVMTIGVVYKYEIKIAEVKIEAQNEIDLIKVQTNFSEKELESYKILYMDSEQQLLEQKQKTDNIEQELSSLKSKIVMSKHEEARASRGGLDDKDLTVYSIMTIDEMNEWISKRAPKDSPFIGKGEIFLKAGAESGLDPKYIVAHAALESSWGKSDIARYKFNFFGIQAYNKSPFNSAKNFSSFENGIIEGAKWIKRLYTDQGQNTLNSMIYGKKAYCQTDSGNPDGTWITKIVNIMS